MQFAVLGCDLKPFATFAETCPLDSKQLSAPFVKFKGIGPKSRFGVIRVLRRPRVALRNGLVAMIQPVMIACGRET